ncbi:MAG: AAA family ATPase [Planctomycetes bacterium]|nr:AAA family ATPase [Planctomycetota bacterium]
MKLKYAFLKAIEDILNSGQSRSIAVTGNILDLFYAASESDDYVPLLNLLVSRWDTAIHQQKLIKIVYELNGPVRFLDDDDVELVREAWLTLHCGPSAAEREKAIERLAKPYVKESSQRDELRELFDAACRETLKSPTSALEFLRQLCLVSHTYVDGKPLLKKKLLIFIEGADMLIPQGEISRLSDADRKRVAICRDWFCDPGFVNGKDSVILICESKSELNDELAHLPQLLEVQIPSPGEEQREAFIDWFMELHQENPAQLWGSTEDLAFLTAGLSLQALMQLLKGSAHSGDKLKPEDVAGKVEDFLKSQIGEDVIEFKRPEHTLKDVVGNTRLKEFLGKKFIPRIKKTGKGSIAGAAVGGALGAGKSFIFEAVAAEIGIPILVLKNLRSKWFGETDVIWERLYRSLIALSKVLIFMDEADTQFGGVGADVHATERRLTGKIQAMMSDPKFRGKVIWLLMTARIHLLSPDLRRPGRAGDMIVPVLDPEGEDLVEFIEWMIKPVITIDEDEAGRQNFINQLKDKNTGCYAAAFASLREELIATADGGKLSQEEIIAVVDDRILPTSPTRVIQTLHALLNCTHLSLLPESIDDIESARENWRQELAVLEKA